MHRILDALADREQESIYHVEKANARYLQFTEITKKITPKLIGSGFKVLSLPAFGGAVGDQGSKVITD